MAKKVNPALLALRREFPEGFTPKKAQTVKCDEGGSLQLPASVPLGSIGEIRRHLLANPNTVGVLSGDHDGTECGGIGRTDNATGASLLATFDVLLFGKVHGDVFAMRDRERAISAAFAALTTADEAVVLAKASMDATADSSPERKAAQKVYKAAQDKADAARAEYARMKGA